jgi:acyl-CoA thioester hydrolase
MIMYCYDTQVRVRYSETDQMGVVYYGHYAQYLEVGRAEAMRALGFTYRDLEERGVLMPVIELQLQYLRPARYDDLLTVRTRIKELPEKTMTFLSEIFNESDRLLTTGSVTLAFLDKQTGRTCTAPLVLLDLLQPRYL